MNPTAKGQQSKVTLACPTCHYDLRVAFTKKRWRTTCPECGGKCTRNQARVMADPERRRRLWFWLAVLPVPVGTLIIALAGHTVFDDPARPTILWSLAIAQLGAFGYGWFADDEVSRFGRLKSGLVMMLFGFIGNVCLVLVCTFLFGILFVENLVH
ncbi:MAG: hypothetical protein O7G85_00305 [Planctomycetota bacterium]|nr:hypothetical protein [Planctomycetota bacterium]